MTTNTKNNKTCINLSDELNPLNMINAFCWVLVIEDAGDLIYEIIEGVGS